MTEPMSTGHRASIDAHLAHVRETGQTMGDVYLRDAVDEIDRLRAAIPAWADLKAVLAEHRDSDLTDNELTTKVMALWGGEDRG